MKWAGARAFGGMILMIAGGFVRAIGARGLAGSVVMVKCPACGKLNEEESKFCQECGSKL